MEVIHGIVLAAHIPNPLQCLQRYLYYCTVGAKVVLSSQLQLQASPHKRVWVLSSKKTISPAVCPGQCSAVTLRPPKSNT